MFRFPFRLRPGHETRAALAHPRENPYVFYEEYLEEEEPSQGKA
jgi:hypothetical protein